MNRRSFLKRIAAVAVGSVAVPTTVKKFYNWHWADTVTVLEPTPDPGEDFIRRNMSSYPKYEVGSRIILSNGHVYVYMKVENNANNPKNHQHNQT